MFRGCSVTLFRTSLLGNACDEFFIASLSSPDILLVAMFQYTYDHSPCDALVSCYEEMIRLYITCTSKHVYTHTLFIAYTYFQHLLQSLNVTLCPLVPQGINTE